MRVESVDVPTSATSLASLIDEAPRHTNQVGLQAPEANAAIVFFGNKDKQPFELRPMANVLMPVANFREIFVLGTGGDKLSIVLFDGC